MAQKYLDINGLSYLISSLKSTFISKPTSLTIDSDISYIDVNESKQLVSYTDIDDSILYLPGNSNINVTPLGYITGVSKGTGIVYVIPSNNVSLMETLSITVNDTSTPVVYELTSNVDSITVSLDDGTYDISSITITYGDNDVTSSVSWSSSDITMMTISNNTLTLLSEGSCNLICTYDSKTLSIPVSITSIGQVNEDNTITLNLDSGTYTLKYEDDNNTPLEDFDEITTLTI